eukprot:scaffold5462_cov103-Skeletonema_dohrnii-CCMP3373.AAC.10
MKWKIKRMVTVCLDSTAAEEEGTEGSVAWRVWYYDKSLLHGLFLRCMWRCSIVYFPIVKLKCVQT